MIMRQLQSVAALAFIAVLIALLLILTVMVHMRNRKLKRTLEEQIDVLLVQKSHGILRRKIIKRFRQKALLENNISSKGFLIYMDNS